MIWHQRPLSIKYDIISLTNSTLLTADMILLCTIKENLKQHYYIFCIVILFIV
jgi:hypothetical protein